MTEAQQYFSTLMFMFDLQTVRSASQTDFRFIFSAIKSNIFKFLSSDEAPETNMQHKAASNDLDL